MAIVQAKSLFVIFQLFIPAKKKKFSFSKFSFTLKTLMWNASMLSNPHADGYKWMLNEIYILKINMHINTKVRRLIEVRSLTFSH